MNFMTFNKNMAEFDRFQRFSRDVNSFTFFETGEVVFCPQTPEPNQRRLYGALGVNVFTQHDANAPVLYTPNGTLVPKAWLGETLVYMVHDGMTDRVVGLQRYRDERDKPRMHIPQWARNFGCYWAGPGSEPVGASHIVLTPPTQYTKEEKEYIDGFRNGYGMIVKVEREWQTPLGVMHIMPTVEVMRVALSNGVPPKEFLRGFSNNVIRQLSDKPTSLLRDEVYVTHLKTTKGDTT